MNANQVIEDLEKISEMLSSAANRPQNYNSEFGQYLEMMSFEMHKHANDLRNLERDLKCLFSASQGEAYAR